MHITASRKELLRVLLRCSGVADRASPIPALANVLLRAEHHALGGKLHIAATDLIVSVTGSISAEITTAGSIAVPARDLVDRVKAMPEGPIQITTDDAHKATLKAVGTKRTHLIHGIPGNEFPPIVGPENGAVRFTVPVDRFVHLIRKVECSISEDTTRPAVNSAFVEWTADLARMVSTDGHRMSKAETPLTVVAAPGSFLLPIKAATLVSRLAEEALSDHEKSAAVGALPGIAIALAERWVFFDACGVRLGAKLPDAQYPPYQQVIPSGPASTVRVDRAALIEAVRSVSLAAGPKAPGFEIRVDAGKIYLSARSAENGESTDEIDVTYTGPSFHAGYNTRYFTEALTAAGGDEVVLWLGTAGSDAPGMDPLVVLPCDGSGFTGVVMPMRI